MKTRSLIKFWKELHAPFSRQCQASFARFAKNALEISESIGLKSGAVPNNAPHEGD
jgi:hypothetical protein